MRIQLAGSVLMQNWARSTHSTVECKHSVGIVGEELRCGESVGMAAGDLIGLNATLGRGLNISALPRNECRVGDRASREWLCVFGNVVEPGCQMPTGLGEEAGDQCE